MCQMIYRIWIDSGLYGPTLGFFPAQRPFVGVPFQTWINFYPSYTHYNVWDEIDYRFPNVNGFTVEV